MPPVAALVAANSGPNLREFKPLPEADSPLVSVIVPARNEAHNIDRCLRSILHSKYRNMQVICVDDRSTDDTYKIAEKVAAGDKRLFVLRGSDPPEGWYGKPWACWQGFQVAMGKVILFTDADTVHGPELLPRAVAALEEERADLVTVMPHQEMIGFWERLVQPFFFLLLGLRFGSARRMNKNRNARHAIANGQFILVTRESYEWVGGHKKVHGTVIEDLMLAVEYVRAGRREYFLMADQDMTTRMYTSLHGIIEGWSKNFFRGMLETTKSHPLAYLAGIWTTMFLLGFLIPPAAILVGAVTFIDPILAFGLASYAGCALLFAMVLRAARAPMIYGMLFPIGAVVSAWIIVRAMVRGTGKIQWKGRTYSHA